MRNKGSKIAMYIEQEYRTRKAYERRKRAQCKDILCEKCKYEKICEERIEEVNNEF